jgi:MFS family permease
MARAREFFSFFHGNVLVLTVCRALWNLSTAISTPYLSLYILALGGSPVEVGFVNSLGLIAGMFLYPVGGYLGDLKGRVKLVSISTYFYSLSFILFVIAQSWTMIALGQFLSQLLLFYSPAMNALMADSLPPNVRGKGFATAMALPNSVGIVAPYLGGLLIAFYGGAEVGIVPAMRLCFTISLVIGLFVATVRLKFLKETVRGDESGPGISLRNFPKLLEDSYLSVLESLRWMPKSIRSIIVLEILETFFVSLAGPFWIIYAKNIIGLTPQSWGALMLIAGICGFTMSFPLGYFVDKYGARPVMLLSLSLAPVSVLFFLMSTSFWGTCAALIFLSVVNTSIAPSFATIVANTVPKERRSRLYALLGDRGINISTGGYFGGGFLLFVPGAIGSFAGGYTYEMGAGLPFTILIIALLVCLFIAYKFVKPPEKAAI